MPQLIRCALCLLVLLLLFAIWGHSVSKRLKIHIDHLPMQILCGFFAYFVLLQVIILPVIFLHNSLRLAEILVAGITLLLTIVMLLRDRMEWFAAVKSIPVSVWTLLAVIVGAGTVLIALRQQYLGYDTCYYIGQMNAFVTYGAFWSRDAFAGMTPSAAIPLHYALSCFYPFFAILAALFGVEARLMALYTVRALCIVLAGCTCYTWGYVLITRESVKEQHKCASLFTIICFILGMFTLSEHSSSFMMMVRGYESKGFCAAVVAPMCLYAIIALLRDKDAPGNWAFLGLLAWASMPIAMSSMAVIPLAIAIGGLILMIEYRQFWSIFWRCLVCVIPNMILMAWYILGK